MELAAEGIVLLLAIYAAAGLLFGLVFVTVGIGRVDIRALKAPLGFRLIILPGVVAFWPLLAKRWAGSRGAGK